MSVAIQSETSYSCLVYGLMEESGDNMKYRRWAFRRHKRLELLNSAGNFMIHRRSRASHGYINIESKEENELNECEVHEDREVSTFPAGCASTTLCSFPCLSWVMNSPQFRTTDRLGSSFRIWIGRQDFHQISVSSYSGHQCNGNQRHQVSDMLQWGRPFDSYDWWESEVFGSAAKGNRARINVFDMLCWWCSAWISLNLFETICHGGIAPCHDVSEQNSLAARTPLIIPRWFWWSCWRRQRVHDDLAVCSF